MIVTHFQRRPFRHDFSLERLFATVRQALPPWVDCRVAVCRHRGANPLKVAYNIVEAACRQAGVNHITGDVGYLAFFLPRSRTLLTIADCGSSLHRLQGWRQRLFRWCWFSIPVRRCALVTVISEHTKQEVIRYTGCPEEKIRVVPVPVGEEFRPSPKEFRADMPVILQVGARANKNVGRVAAALRNMACELHIVGRLRDEDRLCLERAGVRYRVSENLTGEEMLQAYRECDLVVFASTYEGFGMPIIEAQATGRVVVTSSLEPMRDVAGGAAALVDAYDPGSIREGIRKAIEDPAYRESMIERGFRNAARFRAGAIAGQYAALYLELAGRGERPSTVANEPCAAERARGSGFHAGA